MSQVTHTDHAPSGVLPDADCACRGTRARPFMPQAGLLSWISLLGNSPLAFIRTALYSSALLLSFFSDALLTQSSFLLSPFRGIRIPSQSKASPNLLFLSLLSFTDFPSSLASLAPSCHLLLRGPKIMCKQDLDPYSNEKARRDSSRLQSQLGK